MSFYSSQVRAHVRLFEANLQRITVSILPAEPEEARLGAQPGPVHCHIGCAAGAVAPVYCSNDRDRRFRRHPLDITPYIAIKHNIADHQNMGVAPLAFDQLHYPVQILDHREIVSLSTAGRSQILSSTQSQSMWPQSM